MRKKRGVLKLWMAICLTFAGLAGIVGATILTLFLMGKFENEVVMPQSISFAEQVIEGEGFFDQPLSGADTSGKKYFKVASDFKLRIDAEEGVTERIVELRFGTTEERADEEGYISNGVIKVQKYVTLGREFSVILERDEEGNVYGNGVGNDYRLTTLTAVSQNVTANRPAAVIDVDVPIKEISLNVAGIAQAEGEDFVRVSADSTFMVETTFTSANSKYIFSDENQEKEVFFYPSSSAVKFNYDEGKFVTASTAEAEPVEIVAYTFANAVYRENFLQAFQTRFPNGTAEDLAERAYTDFLSNPTAYASQIIKIKIDEVEVTEVSFGGLSSLNPMTIYIDDEPFTLTANSSNGNASLGLKVADTTTRSELFANVGIRLPKNIKLNIVGGKLMKVVQSGSTFSITRVDAIDDLNAEYYVLANSTPKYAIDYYWAFSSSEAFENQELALNFFFERNGVWQNFFKFDGETSQKPAEEVLKISSVAKKDVAPSWKGDFDEINSPIEMTITYDAQGNTRSDDIDLSTLLRELDSNNVYKTIRYFLVATSDRNLSEIFNCKTQTAVAYSQNYLGETLNIENVEMQGGAYNFYEINGSVLTAISNYEPAESEKIYVVAATVKAQGNILDMDGDKYKIVNLSRAKQVLVDSTLSIANMKPTFDVDESIKANEDGNFFIPAINFNDDGTRKDMMILTLDLQVKTSSDVTKLDNAANVEKTLKLVEQSTGKEYFFNSAASQTAIADDQFFVFGKLELVNGTASTFRATITFNDSAFNKARAYNGQKFSFQLVYNDGKDTFSKEVQNAAEQKNDNAFYVYYQRPDAAKFVEENFVGLTYHTNENGIKILDNYFDVVNSANDLSIAMRNAQGGLLNNYTGTREEKIDALNRNFQFTLTDQFGLPINPAVYSIQLEEESDTFTTPTTKVITLNNNTSISNFSAASGKTVYLAVYVVDKNVSGNNNYVYVDGSQERLSLPKVKFEISSEGISYILQSSSNNPNVTGEYERSKDNESAIVSKVVTKDTEIKLEDMIQIYVGTTDTLQTGLIFKLKSTISEELGKMLDFGYVDVQGVQSVSTLKFKSPFRNTTTIDFVVTNVNETFEVNFAFECLSDLDIKYQFADYQKSIDAQYIKSSPRNPDIAGVFGGESYDLDDLLVIATPPNGFNAYSWADLGNVAPSENGLLVDPSGVCISVNNGKLSLRDVYQYTTISFTLYYGVHSTFAPQATIELYVNPNIIIKENVSDVELNPFVSLDDLTRSETTSAKFATSFEFYKATSFIKNGYKFDGLLAADKFSTSGISFKNTAASANQYVQISNNAFVVDAVGKTLNLNLGEECLQTFQIYYTNSNNFEVLVDAIKVRMVDGETRVINLAQGETDISISLGFGEDDDATVNALFDENQNGGKIFTVKYDGTTNLLLSSGGKIYHLQSGVLLSENDSDMTGELSAATGGFMTGQLKDMVFSPAGTTKNSFVVVKNCDGLNVAIKMNAIVSRIGDKFVYYDADGENVSTNESGTTYNFNNFKGVDFKTILGSAAELEKAGVVQKLSAGNEYTILHDTKNGIEISSDNFDGYGFYFHSDLGGNAVVAIESAVGTKGGSSTDLKALNFVSLSNGKLKINDLAQDAYDSVFVVLSCRMTNGAGSFTWLYRIQVEPSFVRGDVRYPYAEDAEYLDIYSSYYNASTGYSINLDEPLTQENSKYDGLTRFMKGSIAFDEAQTSDFAIVKVVLGDQDVTENYLKYFEVANFQQTENGIVFNLKPYAEYANSAISVTIERTYFVKKVTGQDADGNPIYGSRDKAFGSELKYVFKLNQGGTYTHTLWSETISDENKITANENRYAYTLTAGATNESKLIANVKVVESGNISSDVKELSGYIREENKGDLEKALQQYGSFTIKAGTSVQAKDGSGSLVLSEDVLAGKWTENGSLASGEVVEFKSNDTIYSYTLQGNEEIAYNFFYVTQEKFDSTNISVLHINPKASVDKKYAFEAGFFTNEKVVVKIDLTVEGYYNWTLNTINFEGGKKYALAQSEASATNYIFQSIEDVRNNQKFSFESLTIGLVNGQTAYADGLTLQDVVKIYNAADWRNSEIEFAHLRTDATFTFSAKVIEADGTSYTFNFEIMAKASLTQTSVTFADGDYVGGKEIAIDINKIAAASGNEFLSTPDTFAGKFVIKKEVANEDGEKTLYWQEYKTNAELTGLENGDRFAVSNIYVSYMFELQDQQQEDFDFEIDGVKYKEIYCLPLNFSYRSTPNVNLSINYPNPSGANNAQLEYEYLALIKDENSDTYSLTVSDFFNSPALFANGNRVMVEGLEGTSTFTWAISIDNAQTKNATVRVGSNVITDKIVIDGQMESESPTAPQADITFSIQAGVDESYVTFVVEVNKVSRVYKVYLVKDSAVNIQTNFTNSVNSVETIYAEELAGQEKEIFAQSRILTYTTLAETGTYYIRFTNGTNNRYLEIEASKDKVVKDLGESLDGYKYAGTYSNATKTGNNIISVSGELKDENIYISAPNLTARVVAIYADGTLIDLAKNNATLHYSIADESSDARILSRELAAGDIKDFVLAAEVDKVYKLNVVLQVATSEDEIIDASKTAIYSVKMALDFVVEKNADDGDISKAIEVETLSSINSEIPTLLTLSDNANANGFGIRTARPNADGQTEYYTSKLMQEKGGRLTLEEYGFANLKIVSNETEAESAGYAKGTADYDLALSAGKLHNQLLSEKIEGTDYYTGLTPRAHYEINTESDDANTSNYIVIAGNIDNTKATDWTIWAQGANNDGNYVMMKVTYSVVIGQDENGDILASTSHNLLFKVVPSYTVQYTNVYGSPEPNINEVVDGRTVASNKTSMYSITNREFANDVDGVKYVLNLFGADSTATGTNGKSQSLVKVINNEGKDAASNFTYSFTTNVQEGSEKYNNWSAVNAEISETSGWEETEAETEKYIGTSTDDGNLQITLPNQLPLGTRTLLVEFEDQFEFKGRVYIKITSDKNPIIASVSSDTLKEGTPFVFGANYTEINATTSASSVVYDAFKFGYDGNDALIEPRDIYDESNTKIGSIEIGNQIGFEVKGCTITNVELSVSLVSGSGAYVTTASKPLPQNAIITKTITDDSKGFDIFKNDGGWKYNGNEVKFATTDSGNIDLSRLRGSSITMRVLVIRNTTTNDKGEAVESDNMGTYKAFYAGQVEKYNSGATSTENIALHQTYKLGTPVSGKVYGVDETTGKTDTTTINLSGIRAYAFMDSLKAIDMNSVRGDNYDFTSDVNSIVVKKVQFFYNDQQLGEDVLKSTSKESNLWASLLTDDDAWFVDAENNNLKQGKGNDALADNKFIVPFINSSLFGTGTKLENVEMKVTLGDGDPDNDFEISRMVTIVRSFEDTNLLNEDLLDNNSPTIVANSGLTLLNDTLEVVLEKGESISFVINDKAVDSVDVAQKTLKTAGEEGETKEANIITLTNTTGRYAITEYVAITKNIVGLEENLASGDEFHIYVTSHTINGKATTAAPVIRYKDGSALRMTMVEIEDAQGKIRQYTAQSNIASYSSGSGALTLHIADVEELNGESKQQELYFLVENKNQVYRYEQTFFVYPTYNDTEVESFEIEDFLTVTDSNTGKMHYVISLENWAKNVKLLNKIGQYSDGTFDTFNANLAYKFKFEIGSQNGAAFIDEYGKITTTEDFEITTNYIVVKVYMKVSGNDGLFENDVDVITPAIGTITIRLKSSGQTSTATKSGIYNVSGYGIVVVPNGTGEEALEGAEELKFAEGTTSLGTLACTVGTTLDLQEVFKEKNSTYNNKHYHIVKMNDEYVWFDNIDTYQFTKQGNFEVWVAMTYGNAGSALQYKFNIMVYDNSLIDKVEKFEEVDGTYINDAFVATSSSLNGNTPIGENETWYEITGNFAKEASTDEDGNIKISFNKAGVETRQYLVATTIGNETTYKLYTFTFYVSSETIQKTVAMEEATKYALNQLYQQEEGYTYAMQLNGITQTEGYFPSYGVNSDFTMSYMLLISKGGQIVDVKKYEVKFYIVGNSTTEKAYFALNENSISKADIEKVILERLNITAGKILMRLADNTLVGDWEEISLETGIFRATERFVVEYTNSNNNKVFKALTLDVFAYSTADNAEPTDKPSSIDDNVLEYGYDEETGVYNFTWQADRGYTSFALSNLASVVKKVLNVYNNNRIADNTIVTFAEYSSEIASIPFEDPRDPEIYYVRVGNEFFLFNITLTIST